MVRHKFHDTGGAPVQIRSTHSSVDVRIKTIRLIQDPVRPSDTSLPVGPPLRPRVYHFPRRSTPLDPRTSRNTNYETLRPSNTVHPQEETRRQRSGTLPPLGRPFHVRRRSRSSDPPRAETRETSERTPALSQGTPTKTRLRRSPRVRTGPLESQYRARRRRLYVRRVTCPLTLPSLLPGGTRTDDTRGGPS